MSIELVIDKPPITLPFSERIGDEIQIIFASKGRVIGGLSISSSIDIHNLKSLQEFKPQLLKTSELIGKEAGAWNFPEQNN